MYSTNIQNGRQKKAEDGSVWQDVKITSWLYVLPGDESLTLLQETQGVLAIRVLIIILPTSLRISLAFRFCISIV